MPENIRFMWEALNPIREVPIPQVPFPDPPPNINAEFKDLILFHVANSGDPIFHGWEPVQVYLDDEIEHLHFGTTHGPFNIEIGGVVGQIRYGRNFNTGQNVVYLKTLQNADQNRVRLVDLDIPQPVRRELPAFKKEKVEKKQEYYVFDGYKFKKPLDTIKRRALRNYGYETFLLLNPSYKYVEPVKEDPINASEEVIVNVFELADYYATEELKRKYPKFELEEHTEEYEKIHKAHIKKIKSFKRNNNG